MTSIFALLAAAAGQGGAGPVDSVEITVYNQNFGLVKEIRQVNLKQGVAVLAIEDVAATIDPSTVHFKSLDDPQGVEVLEQNFRFDLLGPNSILEKSVGKKVRLHRTLPDGKKEVLEGTLLTPPSQGTVIRTSDGRFVLSPAGEVEVMELPEGLIAKPTLFWEVRSAKSGTHRAELSYIANDISWIADYVATLDAKDERLDLGGWVTLTNRTGVTYKDAKLKLVAGDVRRAQPEMAKSGMMRGAGPAAELGLGGFAESQLFEYHLYTLGRPTTIANKEIKQVSLLNAADVPATKKLIYEGQGFYWRSYGPNYRPGDGVDTDPNQKVHVVVEIVNSEKNRLGMPLPKGRVRVYKQDVEGQLQFVGEDTIDHTPRDEKIKLYIGDAFDVVCTRTRTDFRRISTDVIEQSFEINARNRKKDEAVTLTIAEHPSGDWEVLEKSHDFTKVDARTIHFVVEIPAGQELKVSYRVRSKF